MGAEMISDFPVASNGHCFFCLNQIVTLKPRPLDKQINTNSLQYLSRHVNMDLRKVFMDKEQVSPELLAKVEKARLKVELCEECSYLSERFSKVYRKLEKLEMELGSTLELIVGKMESKDATDKLKGLILSSNANWNGLFEVLDVLRAEAIQKSSIKLSRTPLVKIQNLSQQEVRAKQFRLEKRSKSNLERSRVGTITDFEASHKLEASKFKVDSLHEEMESLSDNDNCLSNNGDSNLDTVTMEDDEKVENQDIRGDANAHHNIVSKNLMIEVQHEVSPPDQAQNVSCTDKCTVNPETKKRKCNACHMEFKTMQSFVYHYQTVHLKLRYKCVFCNKLFSVKGNLLMHQRTSGSCKAAESPPKFNCHLCEKRFSQKQTLQNHLDGVHFKILKYGCNICKNKFMTKVALFTHRRQVHSGKM